MSPQAAVGSLQSGARGRAGMPYASSAVGGQACQGPSPKPLPSPRCAKGQGWGHRESCSERLAFPPGTDRGAGDPRGLCPSAEGERSSY